MIKSEKPEILAPAGSIDSLKAAVAAGCDAVYIGGNKFGARAYAENPDEEDMLGAIDYCHLHGVKVYMTVNTLLKNWEMRELYDFLLPYYKAGLDAVLVQDMGVLSFISEHFPKLPIHASTQMTITQGKTAEFLKQYHVTRIVPARELSLEEIRQMREDTTSEIEIFVHGALCYCYSGQCLFSSMLGDRSGNRGRCAQPCRKRYEAEGSRGYFLSPRELCNLPHIGELIEAGVDSFKIEGRMKRPEYTALVTSIYRKYVDLYISLGKEGYEHYRKANEKEWEEDYRALADLYSREGFTSGYLEGSMGNPEERHPGKKGEMLAGHRPNHGGVLAGRVLSVGKKEAVYEALEDLGGHDVLEFRDKNMDSLYEYTLGSAVKRGERVSARYRSEKNMKAAAFVYRTKNAGLLLKIQERYLSPKDRVTVKARFFAAEGEKLSLSVNLAGTEVTVYGEECRKAKNRSATDEDVRSVLIKTGESEFYFEKLQISLTEGLFINVGALKKLRREAFSCLKEKFLKQWRRDGGEEENVEKNRDLSDKESQTDRRQKIRSANSRNGEKTMVSASVLSSCQLEPVLSDERIRRVYLQTEKLTFTELGEAFQRIKARGKSPWLAFPHIFRKGVERFFSQEMEKNNGIFSLAWDGFLLKNLEEYLFVKERIPDVPLMFDAGLYIMNDEAACLFGSMAKELTVSTELTEKEIRHLSWKGGLELIGYTRPLMMVSAQCMQANLRACAVNKGEAGNRVLSFRDEKKRRFLAMNVCRYCYNMIWLDEPVYLKSVFQGDVPPSVTGVRYGFTTETEEEVEKILTGKFDIHTSFGHFYKGVQ